jgi:DNA-binding NarL/FixJ family response regulator
LRATWGLPPRPTGRPDRYLAAEGYLADQRIDEGAAALLWSRGLALSPEAAVDLAIEQALRAPGRDGAPGVTTASAPHGALAGALAGVLTAREREIAGLIARGRSNKAIAAELVISPATVARHVANIMAKLGFRNRAQIAAWITERVQAPG